MINYIKYFLIGNATAVYFVVGATVVGFGGGLYVHSKFDDAAITKQLQNKIVLDGKSVNASNKAELGIVEDKDAIEIKYVTLTKEIIRYVPKTIYTECRATDGTIVDTTLNTGAVRVLNGDTSPDLQSTSIGDAEVKAPTEVGLQELSEYVLTIKKQYEELATSHDGLVDYNIGYKALIKQ
jgi:hypothetical protein